MIRTLPIAAGPVVSFGHHGGIPNSGNQLDSALAWYAKHPTKSFLSIKVA